MDQNHGNDDEDRPRRPESATQIEVPIVQLAPPFTLDRIGGDPGNLS